MDMENDVPSDGHILHAEAYPRDAETITSILCIRSPQASISNAGNFKSQKVTRNHLRDKSSGSSPNRIRKRRRCIIPANGFYEWALSPIAADSDSAEIEAEEEAAVLIPEAKRIRKAKSSGKTPYRFDMANGRPFAFAGLWDAWKEPKRSPEDVDH